MAKLKTQIPNLLTLGNLTCGVLAAYVAALGRLHWAAVRVMCGIVFDFFDGFAARMLKVASPLGKELDSLADVVTSGVAPAIILFRLLLCFHGWKYWALVAFLMPAFAAYRLGKFNLDTRQSHSFLGLPVPSNALIWVSIGLCAIHPDWAQVALIPIEGIDRLLLSNPALIALAAFSLFTDWLMVSEVPLMGLKFTSFGWKENWERYVLLMGAAALLLLFGLLGIALSIVWYILFSLLTARCK